MKVKFQYLALLGILFLCLQACGKKSTANNQPPTMTPDAIKAKIIEKDMQPSPESLARKEKSINLLKQQNVPILATLPVIEDSVSVKKRTREEIAGRAIALCLVALKGEGLEQATIQRLVTQYGAQGYFTPVENKFINNPSPTQQDRVAFSWQYEDYWVLLWALGYIDTLDFPDKVCDVAKAVKILHDHTTADFIAQAKLRPESDILDAADLIYRYDWASVNARAFSI